MAPPSSTFQEGGKNHEGKGLGNYRWRRSTIPIPDDCSDTLKGLAGGYNKSVTENIIVYITYIDARPGRESAVH